MKRLGFGLVVVFGLIFATTPPAFGADTQAPVLVDWKLTDEKADISTGDATVGVEFSISDDSEIDGWVILILSSQSSTQSTGLLFSKLISKVGKISTYQAFATIGLGKAPGEWSWKLYPLKDILGNSSNFGPGGNWPVNIFVYDKDFTEAKQLADAKAAAELKAKQDADAKAAADLKAKQEAEAKAATDAAIKAATDAAAKAVADANAAAAKAVAEAKAIQDAAAKAAAELKAKQDADAKAAAELKAKQEAEAKAAAELKAKQEADAKAAELKAKQEADTKAAELKAKQDSAADKAALAKAQSELTAANAALADSQKVNRELQSQLSAIEVQFKLLSDSVVLIQGQVSQLNSKLGAALKSLNTANAKLKKVCSVKPKPKGC